MKVIYFVSWELRLIYFETECRYDRQFIYFLRQVLSHFPSTTTSVSDNSSIFVSSKVILH